MKAAELATYEDIKALAEAWIQALLLLLLSHLLRLLFCLLNISVQKNSSRALPAFFFIVSGQLLDVLSIRETFCGTLNFSEMHFSISLNFVFSLEPFTLSII